MWRPIATIAAAARDVELEEPVLKLSWYSIYINVVLNIFIFLGGGPTLIRVARRDDGAVQRQPAGLHLGRGVVCGDQVGG